jgi:hypothetical protein
MELVAERGLTFLHPFDDPDVIAGQGTIGMEILRQHPEPPYAIFVPVGGGGLIAGIAAYVKWLMPGGAHHRGRARGGPHPARGPGGGRRVELEQVGLFADGVAVRLIGKETFRIARQRVDEVVLVSTDEICAAIKDIFDDTRGIAEPAGALAVAGLKRYVERTGIRGSTWWPSRAGPTSTSTACATSPSAPSWASGGRPCWRWRSRSARGASSPSAGCWASARSPSSTTATPTRTGPRSSSASSSPGATRSAPS